MGQQLWMAVFKPLLYLLLFANVFLFIREASPTKAIDEVGWLLLLAVFEWETRSANAGRTVSRWALAVELTGYALAIYAFVQYARTGEWLDLGNSTVWLAISALIVLDVLRPVPAGSAASRRRLQLKVPLYAATLVFALAWGVTGIWLDFWDALLWILCFFIVEINIFRIEAGGAKSLASAG
ncbi:hypothetical protein [Sandarakinorhabdus sp. DWP1-3-1]|uniref:hypothetical protein n=1 Tax=Sandarakinorhabdus sp. DWP1-3-1 TaxID=2804627 RepID=UPI003CF623CA